MKKFIESVRMQNGKAALLELHQRRFDLTRLAHYGVLPAIDLSAAITQFVASGPGDIRSGFCKLRITYSREIETMEAEKYTPRSPASVALVEADRLEYRFKYADRSGLDSLRDRVAVGSEPLIVQNGLVTDGIYANLCFFDGAKWLTPEQPLLAGVARAVALASGVIVPEKILARDVEQGRFTKIRLINCMNWFAEAHEVPC